NPIGEQGQVSLSYCSLAAIPPPSPAMLDAVALSAPGINYGAYLSTNPSDGSLGNYEMDPLFLAPIPTMRISSSSSSSHGFDGLSEFREY
ncbi:PREDICTED: VQ motif-containing protein 20-like, partial [Tarenaya hassleriana]|uniref:VQ motif-containing protein 20-like n=1 Tax=Tarenaya hassleriana TaxID=28532 RepID=UPI0008FCE413